jgi:hypothetical protein
VMDNLSSHHQKSLTDLYGKEMASEVWNCFTVHYADSDDVDQSFRSHADQIGAKRRRALSV